MEQHLFVARARSQLHLPCPPLGAATCVKVCRHFFFFYVAHVAHATTCAPREEELKCTRCAEFVVVANGNLPQFHPASFSILWLIRISFLPVPLRHTRVAIPFLLTWQRGLRTPQHNCKQNGGRHAISSSNSNANSGLENASAIAMHRK